jgi:ADP-ribose pyrophosphatase YjhB (NUDIX family)
MHRFTDSVRIAIFEITNPTRFLVVTESDDPDNWKLPGGKFEVGEEGVESPGDAAERELREEVGVHGAQIGLRVADTLVNDDGVSARYIFTGTASADTIKPSKEIAKAQWFTEDTLPDCKNRGHILGAVAAARTQLDSDNLLTS